MFIQALRVQHVTFLFSQIIISRTLAVLHPGCQRRVFFPAKGEQETCFLLAHSPENDNLWHPGYVSTGTGMPEFSFPAVDGRCPSRKGTIVDRDRVTRFFVCLFLFLTYFQSAFMQLHIAFISAVNLAITLHSFYK